MVDLSNSFVALVLRMTGIESSRRALAAYLDTQFEDISALSDPKAPLSSSSSSFSSSSARPTIANPEALVQAKSIALVEHSHLVSPLLEVFSLQASQNILNFAKDGELNVMVVREVQAPHSQMWSFIITSNFNLFNGKNEPLRIKIQARYDRALDQLTDLSIDKDEFDLESYRSVLVHYTQYHSALHPASQTNAQPLP